MIFKEHLGDMSESTGIALGKLLDPKLISFGRGIATHFAIKISDPVSSIEYLNKHFKDSDGEVYVSIDSEYFDKIKKLKVKHVQIATGVVCDSDLSRADIEKCVKLGQPNFFVREKDGAFVRMG